MFDDPIFFLSQYFECKQADIEWILNNRRDSISETKPRNKSMRTSLVEYGDNLILIGDFPQNANITVSKLKYSPITVKSAIFKMAAKKLL